MLRLDNCEISPHKTLLTSDTNWELGGSKNDLGFDNSPEGLTELFESSYMHDYALLQGKDTD